MLSMSMNLIAVPQMTSESPVKGDGYKKTLGKARTLSKMQAAAFFAQWYAFSSSIPEILSIAAMKASSDEERANILLNLFSEMGFDSDGKSHPELLKDLIDEATGISPSPDLVSNETRYFLTQVKAVMKSGTSAFNAGVMRSLESVAYEILEVLKEILSKCGSEGLVEHPYITIHELIEASHIESTERNMNLHFEDDEELRAGEFAMEVNWKYFWDNAYSNLVDLSE